MNNIGRFGSGVADYIEGTATVTVYFPIDFRGEADISCRQCYYYKPNTRRCALNGQVTEYPEKFVGSRCPLEIGDADGQRLRIAGDSDFKASGK